VVLLRALRHHGVQGDVYQPQARQHSLEKVQEMPPVQGKEKQKDKIILEIKYSMIYYHTKR